jgi:hypothetical protein
VTTAPGAVPAAPGIVSPTPVPATLFSVDQVAAGSTDDHLPLALAATANDPLIGAAGLADPLSAGSAKDGSVL